MVEAVLQILAVHGDVVRQVRVREEDIGFAGFYLLQHAGEICGVQLKFLIENDFKIASMLIGPLGEALHVIDAVICVLHHDRNLQTLLELALVDQGAKKFGGGGANGRNRRQCAESVLIAFAEDGGSAGPGGDPWGLVAVCHHGFSRSQRRGISA